MAEIRDMPPSSGPITTPEIAHMIRILLEKLTCTNLDKSPDKDAKDRDRDKYKSMWVSFLTGSAKDGFDPTKPWTKIINDATGDILELDSAYVIWTGRITLDMLFFLIFYFRVNASNELAAILPDRRSVTHLPPNPVRSIRAQNMTYAIKSLVQKCTAEMAIASPKEWLINRTIFPGGIHPEVRMACDNYGTNLTAGTSHTTNAFEQHLNALFNAVMLADIVTPPPLPKHIARPTPSSSTTVLTPFRTADTLVGMYTSSSTMTTATRDLVLSRNDSVTLDTASCVTMNIATRTIASRILLNLNKATGQMYVSYVHPCISAEYLFHRLLSHCDKEAVYHADFLDPVFTAMNFFNNDDNLPAEIFPGGAFSMEKLHGLIDTAEKAAIVDVTTNVMTGKTRLEYITKATEKARTNLGSAQKVIVALEQSKAAFSVLRRGLYDNTTQHNSLTATTSHAGQTLFQRSRHSEI
jgi:hypothetical protein